MAAVHHQRTGVAAATINAIRQTGTSLDIALLACRRLPPHGYCISLATRR